MKQRLKDRFEKPTYHFLSDTIFYSRNAERSHFGPLGIFGNPHSSQRLGHKGPSLELLLECCQIRIQVLLEHLDAHLVDSRRTAVLFDRLEG